MYKNTGEKITTLAETLFGLMVCINVLFGIVLLVLLSKISLLVGSLAAIVLCGLGILLSYIAYLVLAGFGELITKTSHIDEMLSGNKLPTASVTQTSSAAGNRMYPNAAPKAAPASAPANSGKRVCPFCKTEYPGNVSFCEKCQAQIGPK